MSGDYTKINSMSKDELREFVLFVCTAYPTLLEALAAHEKHTQFAKDHPESLDMDTIYSRDDEGNGYQEVYYEPAMGIYDAKEREFMNNPEDMEEYELSEKDFNAVIIN